MPCGALRPCRSLSEAPAGSAPELWGCGGGWSWFENRTPRGTPPGMLAASLQPKMPPGPSTGRPARTAASASTSQRPARRKRRVRWSEAVSSFRQIPQPPRRISSRFLRASQTRWEAIRHTLTPPPRTGKNASAAVKQPWARGRPKSKPFFKKPRALLFVQARRRLRCMAAPRCLRIPAADRSLHRSCCSPDRGARRRCGHGELGAVRRSRHSVRGN